VWLGERRTSIATTKFALKLPRDEEIDQGAIRQEAEVWVEASGHPNVLPIIEADIYDNQVVIVSEYAPDGSLSEWLSRHSGKSRSLEQTAELMTGILAGLHHLHTRPKRILHRDLKPQNVLLQGDTPRLADFGIARVLRTSSQSTTVAGTLPYMAPEAFDGKRTVQTDLWSAGVMLYEMLSGKLPFPQTDMTGLIGAIIARSPDPLPPSIPIPLQRMVLKVLDKDPDQRYRSAAEMRDGLRLAIQEIGSQHAGRNTEPATDIPTARSKRQQANSARLASTVTSPPIAATLAQPVRPSVPSIVQSSLTRPTRATSFPGKLTCKILGVVFMLLGICGFLAPNLLGAHLNPPHNVVHIVSGVIALYFGFAGSMSGAKGFCLVFGIVYLALGILGLALKGADMMWHVGPLMLGQADDALHILLGVIFLASGLFTKSS
jgi:serine/threonine protein kinase